MHPRRRLPLSKESFGSHGQPGCDTDEDFGDAIFLFGHNVAETSGRTPTAPPAPSAGAATSATSTAAVIGRLNTTNAL